MTWAALGSGIVEGFAIALVAVGFTVIYNATGVVNFANGQLMVLGGYIGYFAYAGWHLPFPLAAALAVGGGAVLGIFSDRIVIGPLRRASLLVQVIALLGLSYVLDSLYLTFFGSESKSFPPYAGTIGIIPALHWSVMDIVIIVACAAIIGALVVFLYRTPLGTEMRATADNQFGASLVGIDPRTVAAVAWSLGGGLAALSGVLLMPKAILSITVGPEFTFAAFAAVVLGGFGSLSGAVIGGLVIGIANALVAGLFAAGYEPLVSLVVMLVILPLKPTGLVGERG